MPLRPFEFYFAIEIILDGFSVSVFAGWVSNFFKNISVNFLDGTCWCSLPRGRERLIFAK